MTSNNTSAFKNDMRFNILFLTKWYPSKFDELGIFVQKHAKAVSEFCNVNVVYVCSDNSLYNTYQTVLAKENGFLEIVVYYKKHTSVFKSIINAYRYFKATRIGIKEVQKNIGVIDLIHVHIPNRPGLIALLIKIIKGIPYIVTEHWTGYFSGEYEKSNFLKKWVTKIIIKNASAVTTVSESLKQRMLNFGLDNSYEVVPNVIENIPLPEPCNNSKVKILTVADLIDSRKNVSGIIKAISEIIKSNTNIEYHIIGGGLDNDLIRKLSNSLNLTDKFIFFHGAKSNAFVYDFLKCIDFVVINSNIETFSVVAAEALVNGKPVIATVCGGPEEFINSDTGILIEKNNQEQLQQAIIKMISTYKNYDPQLLNKSIINKFNYKTIGKQFYNIYKPLIVRFTVGLSGQKWSINPDWKVLDVGSGHRPNRRANVLIDNELNETEHRSGKKASVPSDKIMVVGDALNMPFEDKEFDFIIASHIAEHVDDPEQFCRELARVGKRGYIETPGAFDEFFLNEPFHKWIVSKKGNCLIFKEKKNFKPFSEFIYSLIYLNQNRTGHKSLYSKNSVIKIMSKILNKTWPLVPYSFTRFYWESKIEVKVIRNK
jgi:glycosyltransferase involved in cell wall biosynthesis